MENFEKVTFFQWENAGCQKVKSNFCFYVEYFKY